MKYLAIDTSGDYLTVISENNGKTDAFFDRMPGVRHSVSLMGIVEKSMANVGLTPYDVDFFAAATGPGSFTGIRIGVATVKGFADAAKKPVLGVTTLKIIAYTFIDKPRFAVIDARHDHFYAEGYGADNGIIYPAKFIDYEELNKLSKTYKLVSNSHIDRLLCDEGNLVKGFMAAINASRKDVCDDVNSIHPFYLRLSQAEEGRP